MFWRAFLCGERVLRERLALFAFVMTVFGWGMRWLGGMLQDAWRAGQSAARR
jgi:hypothetical protein